MSDIATIATCPGVTPIVELGVGSSYDSTSTARWDVDTWEPDHGTSYWAGEKPFWHDVTCHVQDVATFAGRERSIDQFEVGSATVTVDNRDGLFDFPLSTADLVDDSTLLSIRPGRSIRVGVQIDNRAPTYLWAGYIDSANPQYDPVDGARMVIECVDAKGDAGRTDVAKLASAVGAGETATQRVTRVLNAAGWPSYRRSLDTASVQLIATELGGQCVDLLNIAADSAGGHVFGDVGFDDSDPRVAFRGRNFLNYDNTDPFAGSVADEGFPGIPEHPSFVVPLVEDPEGSGLYFPPVEFTEEPAASSLFELTEDGMILAEGPDGLFEVVSEEVVAAVPADTCPTSWELSFARADISTRVLLGRQTDDVPRIYPTPAQLAVASNGTQAGLAMFGVETFERTDLETQNTVDIDWLGERILTTRSWKLMPRVSAVTVTAKGSAPQTYDTLAAASPFTSSRFKCKHIVDGRTVFDRVMLVTGVEHSITPFGWEARISLDDALPFLVGGDHPAHWDETDLALWDFATWADPT